METPFLGQIVMFGGNRAPDGWAFCNGQVLTVTQYGALYSLIGTTYGGDGQTTFALPDLRGRVPIHPGTSSRLSQRARGQKGGQERVKLTTNQLPSHTHAAHMQGTFSPRLKAVAAEPDTASPAGAFPAETESPTYHTGDVEETVAMNTDAVAISGAGAVTIDPAGSNGAHDNMSPFTCTNFIICIKGLFPRRP